MVGQGGGSPSLGISVNLEGRMPPSASLTKRAAVLRHQSFEMTLRKETWAELKQEN